MQNKFNIKTDRLCEISFYQIDSMKNDIFFQIMKIKIHKDLTYFYSHVIDYKPLENYYKIFLKKKYDIKYVCLKQIWKWLILQLKLFYIIFSLAVKQNLATSF